MNPNPFSDTLTFLLQPGWPTPIFWLLLIASAGIAAYAWHTIPSQRTLSHLGNWGLRLLIGYRNRMAVAIDWLWSYVTYQRGARLITGQDM